MQIILSHSNTDFDALAAQHAASRLYPEAKAVLAPQLSAPVAEFLGLYCDSLNLVKVDTLPQTPITQFVLVDTERIWGHWDTAPNVRRLIIDHHPSEHGSQPFQTTRLAVQTGATTTFLVQQLLASQAPISTVEATLFALGIYEDTGDLLYADTTPNDVRCVAALLELGADLTVIQRYRRRALTPEQNAVYDQLQATLNHRSVGGWAVLTGWTALAQHTPDLSGLVERLRDLYQPAVLAVALGLGDGVQIIARSTEYALDVAALVEPWGGGGHPEAAAAWVDEGTPEAVFRELNENIEALIRPARTASDIMTTNLISLRPDSSVQEAAELLRRWDYGAMPVLDADKRLLGDIGRAELVKAERHGLNEAPVQRYMWRRPMLVSPNMPLPELRKVVAAQVRGRVYVTDSDEHVLGVITRGDILHHSERLPSTNLDLQRLQHVQQTMPPSLWERLMWAARWAAERGWGIFVVGGFVRDVLLKRKPGDLDIVVEGDAIAVAQALATHSNGRLRTHEAFGTATILWDDDHLDFITARTEFYEHPTALPQVEAASLRHDLHRRDFTINTLALALSPPHQGHVYDFYGGMRDLERQLIRVLHNLSFVDDPTRLLRAIRLAARLDFQIEPRTGELIDDAIQQDLLNRTTPARIRHELRRIFDEPRCTEALALLNQWGLLQAIHPALTWNTTLSQTIQRAISLNLAGEMRRMVVLLLLLKPLTPAQRRALAERYELAAVQRSQIEQWSALLDLLARLPAINDDGELDTVLSPFSDSVMIAGTLVAPPAITAQLERYQTLLRPTRSLLSGHDLRASGLKPGPQFATVLAMARRQQLNAQFNDHAGALRWLEAYLNTGDRHEHH